MRADILREKFLQFFKERKHRVVESDSLVPKADPTVLFTPAGMNQFKKQFLGLVTDFRRAASSQRCLRTDDLEKVGKTTGHHTFFEMLGNFSFGDYFKKDAIGWAWEFLVEELRIPQEKLWVSVYRDDEEAFKIWKDEVGLPSHKIVRLGDKQNFWPSEAKQKGPNGPCGPCSEIFFDQGQEVGCGRHDCSPACDCGRFLEVWNLVFTQFNRKEGGVLEPLPQKNIDTGMGLERLAAVMQGVANNFETDLFQPIIKEIPADPSVASGKDARAAMYAIADHLRAVVFAVYDGVMPSNEERGYVVRKLIRKSVLAGRSLGIKGAFLYKLVPVVSAVMKAPYPDLAERKENIAQIVLSEEKNFINTLSSSNSLFKEKFAGLRAGQADPEAAGRTAFLLYDTYGIPFELTQEWAGKEKIEISHDAFLKALNEQKNRSKTQSAMKGDVFDVKELHLGTRQTLFQGYAKTESKARILRIVRASSQVKKAAEGEEASIVLDKTPFYPESGGQVGDTGVLKKGKNTFEVTDTQKFDGVIVHKGRVKTGSFKVGDELSAAVDSGRRLSIARNHTATHLLQAALRQVLGTHVKQQGSLVAEERLRFDFTHFKDLSDEELGRVEELVNGFVMADYALAIKQMPLAQAKKTGALAFFGEKYSQKVRVVSVGSLSRELCGGTHLHATGQVGPFKILQEGSVASGIRRIEATTGEFAFRLLKKREEALASVSESLGVPEERAAEELQKRLKRIRELEKSLESQKLGSAVASTDELVKSALKINDKSVIAWKFDGLDMNLLRKAVDSIKEKAGSGVCICLASRNANQAFLVISFSPDLAGKGLDASRLIREVAPEIGGSGGGRWDFAQSGGNRPEGIDRALERFREAIAKTT